LIAEIGLHLRIQANHYLSHHCGCGCNFGGYEYVDIRPLCALHPPNGWKFADRDAISARATNPSECHEDIERNKNYAYLQTYQQAYSETQDTDYLTLINLTMQLVYEK